MITINTPGAAYEYEYKGLSTDAKPTDCAANSLFLELDTGKFYYFDGEAWNELGAGGGGGDGVLFEGTLVFTVDDPEVTCPEFDILLPEDGDPVQLYVDGVLEEYGSWRAVEPEPGTTTYEAIWESDPDSFTLLEVYGTPMKGHLSSSTAQGWTAGSKTVKICKPSA